MDRGRLAGVRDQVWAHLPGLAWHATTLSPWLAFAQHLAPGTGACCSLPPTPMSCTHHSSFSLSSSFSHLAQGSLSHRLVFFSLFGFLSSLSLSSRLVSFRVLGYHQDQRPTKNCIISPRQTSSSKRIPIPTPHSHLHNSTIKTSSKRYSLTTPIRTALRPFPPLPLPLPPPGNLH